MAQHAENIETWDDLAGEESMAEGHEPAWRTLISYIEEDTLSGKKVLDFGCNRGGFLKLLHQQKPYAEGLGVDIADESVAFANSHKGNTPCTYDHSRVLATKTGEFDIAFSHEVVYLLPDLLAHAREMRSVLKIGGVYYLAIGEYAENPLWERWKKTVSEFSPVPPQTYSLQDIAKAFQDSGFAVSIRRMVC
ncbi:MAG: class I SAM-dependent methyltransferase, partial [Alphaproteobacteria bacterium]|nr:class I SAM-dependent methyltransferase [Alphaproteobacteria bacterium]